MTLARLLLANALHSTASALTPFASAALLDPLRSLPRIVLARLSLRLVCWLMLTGKRLAPEVARY
ncbi:MAG: hypothetical protein WB820_09295 [Rhodoplanes sp.]